MCVTVSVCDVAVCVCVCVSDDVKFGDVVLEPPTLSVKPRHATNTASQVCSTLSHSVCDTVCTTRHDHPHHWLWLSVSIKTQLSWWLMSSLQLWVRDAKDLNHLQRCQLKEHNVRRTGSNSVEDWRHIFYRSFTQNYISGWYHVSEIHYFLRLTLLFIWVALLVGFASKTVIHTWVACGKSQ